MGAHTWTTYTGKENLPKRDNTRFVLYERYKDEAQRMKSVPGWFIHDWLTSYNGEVPPLVDEVRWIPNDAISVERMDVLEEVIKALTATRNVLRGMQLRGKTDVSGDDALAQANEALKMLAECK